MNVERSEEIPNEVQRLNIKSSRTNVRTPCVRLCVPHGLALASLANAMTACVFLSQTGSRTLLSFRERNKITKKLKYLCFALADSSFLSDESIIFRFSPLPLVVPPPICIYLLISRARVKRRKVKNPVYHTANYVRSKIFCTFASLNLLFY